MSAKLLTSLLLASALALPALARPAAAPAPQISVRTLRDVTRTLSSDAFEGRAPTSAAEPKVIAFISDRFAKAGLKPGNKGSWTQGVPMVEITVAPTAALAFTGGKAPVTLAYKTDMVISTRQVRPKVEIANSDVVFVGYGINAPEKAWNDYGGIDVRGKTVIILINDPDWQTTTLTGDFNGRAMTYYGRWTYKYEEAARQGAAAAIIIHDTEPAAYPFGVVVSSWAKPVINLDAQNDHMDESKAIGWMTGEGAARLFASAGKDLATMKIAAKTRGFRAMSLGLKLNVTLDNTIRRQVSQNVVGILPGTTRASEYVLYTAHWDHLGHCEPVKGDGICNGALDNASGVAGLVALAEAAAKSGATPRSQVFLAVTAEEAGLLGSEYYAKHPVFPLSQTVGGVNMDVLNVRGKTRDVEVTGVGKSDLDDYVKRYAAVGGRTISPESTPEKGHYYRSDHFSFAKLGVPMLAAGGGEDLVVGGVAAGKAAAEDYNINRYHKPQDEYVARWDWSGAVQDLTMYYGIAHELATTNVWPNWKAGDEFRAIRDKSRAGK
ncbi:M28 family peptidase [Sphingomonas sp.]|uniref:M28 family peptidase n=1 Tax=Sphingomonas sp. TaxID=28214 RepID=UPI0025D673EF|nr:M28 family peptidase [Sphingomonas sp.]